MAQSTSITVSTLNTFRTAATFTVGIVVLCTVSLSSSSAASLSVSCNLSADGSRSARAADVVVRLTCCNCTLSEDVGVLRLESEWPSCRLASAKSSWVIGQRCGRWRAAMSMEAYSWLRRCGPQRS